jgi:uncharacterized protein (TIGR01777 family)
MNILLTGSHGLIGRALVPALTAQSHRTVRLIRVSSTPAPDDVVWDPATGQVADPSRLDGFDAVIHLAGESIAAGRWTQARKARIRESRVRGTRLLADILARSPHPPRMLICASAVGYYGDRGQDILREESAPGTGFLAEVCREWEAASDPARRAGIRVAHLRTGIVLSPAGGALARLLPMCRLGLGGALGSGRQYMSWIAIDDVVGAILHLLANAGVAGPVNLVAPRPVTNREFTAALGRVLGRPTLFAVPAVALRIALGEMAGELLGSVRAEPAALQRSGYTFRHPDLEGALRALLGRSRGL